MDRARDVAQEWAEARARHAAEAAAAARQQALQQQWRSQQLALAAQQQQQRVMAQAQQDLLNQQQQKPEEATEEQVIEVGTGQLQVFDLTRAKSCLARELLVFLWYTVVDDIVGGL